MAAPGLDAKIDQLYQLPLDKFTSARNALAREAGADAAKVRALVKPPIAAWAVNQLFWRDADAWNALIEAAENARRTHKAVLSGRGGDVRAAGTVHEEAADAALKRTLGILADAGHPVTDATRQAIATTIRALPADESPGRLTRALQPGGFEMLAGLSVAPGAGKPAKPATPVKLQERAAKTAAPPSSASAKADAKALTRAREAAAAAANAVRDAERAVQREEFEVARTSREAERASRAIDDARKALDRAKSDLDEAELAAKTTARQRDEAAKRAAAARKQLTIAREHAEQFGRT
jgi:hypothetical protein